MNYKIIDDSPISISHFDLHVKTLLKAIKSTNDKFEFLSSKTSAMHLDVFDVIDFRVLSGLVGETFITELSKICPELNKNPNIDGYPDLCQVATSEMISYFNKCTDKDFIKYKYGGIEVKNTFGTKKAGSFIIQGDSRIEYINSKLDWKAHHQQTNNLIALYADYFNKLPKIVALFYCDTLTTKDWSGIQKPKAGSAMTSFSCITSEGYKKIISNMKICIDDPKFLNYFKAE